VAATPPSHFSDAGKDAAPTGDEGVASTFLRRGVAATCKPASEFGLNLTPALGIKKSVANPMAKPFKTTHETSHETTYENLHWLRHGFRRSVQSRLRPSKFQAKKPAPRRRIYFQMT
jgi:hypothetical protein